MRIVHDGNKVIARITSDSAKLVTPHTVFSGTPEECQAEIERLKLATPGPNNRRVDDHLVTGHSSQVTS